MPGTERCRLTNALPPPRQDQQKPAEEGHFPVATWLRLEELGLVRRWSITLSRKPDTGRYGLGLNEGNEVTVAPEGSGLMLADIIIGCEGERLGLKRLEDHLLHHGEPTIELEVRARPRSDPSPPCLHSTTKALHGRDATHRPAGSGGCARPVPR